MRVLPALVIFFAFVSCRNSGIPDSRQYTMLDYRQVKLQLDTLNEQLQAQADSTGTYCIPYTDLKNGRKHLVFFGTSHVRDLSNPQFAQLRKAFQQAQPQIAFNEGGQIPASRHYVSADSAILKNGEIGLLKFLCDSAGISMLNGDLEDSLEMRALKQIVPTDQIYLYMGVERFLNGYRQGRFPGLTLEAGWQSNFIPYVQAAGLQLNSKQASLDTFKAIYKQYLGREFVLDSLVDLQEYYLIDNGKLGDVGRATKIVRDRALLEKIDKALDKYDRVFVVFGGSHRIALEPALKQLIAKPRK